MPTPRPRPDSRLDRRFASGPDTRFDPQPNRRTDTPTGTPTDTRAHPGPTETYTEPTTPEPTTDLRQRPHETPPAPPPPPRSMFRAWLAVGAVALGIFSLMTSELLPVGLLTPVGATLDVSEGTAGLMVTAPGIVAAFAAPVIAVTAGRLDRRLLLAALIALVGAANLINAAAPNFAVVLIARALVGVGVGGFWAIAGGLALRLVPPEQVARATAIVFGGVSTASVLGVPAGTLMGELTGWRTAFAAVGSLGLVALVALVVLLPPLPSAASARPMTFREPARLGRDNRGVRAGLALTFLLITGHFVAYTFVRPILRDVSGVDDGLIGLLLLGYGLAGVAGNFAAAGRASRDARRTLLTIAIGLTAALTPLAALTAGTVRRPTGNRPTRTPTTTTAPAGATEAITAPRSPRP